MAKIEYMTNAFQSDLKPRARLVLHCLALHSNKEGQCFPSIKTIAKECGYSVNTIKRALDDLVEAGFVVKEARFDTERKHGGQTSNLYTLNIVQSKDNQNEEPVMAEKQVIDIVTESKEEKADDTEDKTVVEKTNDNNELGVALKDYCQNQRHEKIERSYPIYNFTWAGEEPKGASP
jgi:DNA-binding transcriptional regulator YhcF (GntR family)